MILQLKTFESLCQNLFHRNSNGSSRPRLRRLSFPKTTRRLRNRDHYQVAEEKWEKAEEVLKSLKIKDMLYARRRR